jgi:hypothetical protein
MDAFVAKYDSTGTRLWARQLGTNLDDYSFGLSADGFGNVYVAGRAGGNLGGASFGGHDAFVAKFDAAGNALWTTQIGYGSSGLGVSADDSGNVYLVGEVNGPLSSGADSGGSDAFLTKFDAAGNLDWSWQMGPSQYDVGESVSADGNGRIYITGITGGNIGGPNVGGLDVFIAKFSDAIPEPSGALLLITALLSHSASIRPRRRGSVGPT